MEQNEVVILKNYLKRKIAECNSTISSMTFKFKDDARLIKKNILRNFARGNVDKYSRSIGNENLQEIYLDIQKHGKDVAPYNYFDLDTLFAYYNYVSMIVEGLFTERELHRRIYTTLKDCELVVDKKVPEFFVNNAGTIHTGFYNLNRTIVPLKNENGHIMYERTPEKKTFENKHPKGECFVLLQKYIHEREGALKKNAPSVCEQTTIDFMSKPQTDDIQADDLHTGDKEYNANTKSVANDTKLNESQNYIILKKLKFYLIKEELYLDEQFSPIKYVEGYTENGKSKIYGYFDMCGNVYHGDVYDMEGNLEVCSVDSGVMIFGEHETTKFDGLGR